MTDNNPANAPLTLKVQVDSSSAASQEPVTSSADAWTGDYYPIGASRGGAAEKTAIEIEEGSVVEFTLEGGQRILVAAGDVAKYFPDAVRSTTGVVGEITIGAFLTPPGLDAAALSRDGFGTWLIKGLRVLKRGPAAVTAIVAAGTFQDMQLDHRLGLYRVRTDQWRLDKVPAVAASAKPILVLLHGTISSAEGSFKGLWEQPTRGALAELYGDRVYALEHRTLTESPVVNALELANALPAGATLHLLSHSRGGLVGELIARANRTDSDPFNTDDLEQLLAQAEAMACEGYDAIADGLKDLNEVLKKKAIRVERFVRVACPARGTTILAGKLDRWGSVMTNLLGLGIEGIGAATGLGRLPASIAKAGFSFFASVIGERKDARTLPGLEAMMPESPLVAMLNRDDAQLRFPLHVVAGDFVGDGVLKYLGDSFAERYYEGQTDLVVNTASMAGGARRSDGLLYQLFVDPPGCHHLNYFRRPASSRAIVAALRGDDSGFQRVEPSRAHIARGGKKTLPRKDSPIVLLLPGIMGSGLQRESDYVWFNFLDILAGGISKLGIDAPGVSPSGWLDDIYESLARHLNDTHEVRPFAFDWRISLEAEAARFGQVLDEALADGESRRKPVRIVAHSMGGLVARLALSGRWDRFKALPGARFLQLGTPNGGSASIAQVLLGRDKFVRMMQGLDLRHDMRAFLAIVSGFPGVMEMLPWVALPGEPGTPTDYFSPAVWREWAQVEEAGGELRWVKPAADALAKAKAVTAKIGSAPIDPEVTLYVAGCASRTPVSVRLQGGQVEIGMTSEGDGRVPWSTGIPAGVRAWYVEAEHGDLPKVEEAFNAYVQLLEMGETPLLPQKPAGVRDAGGIRYEARSLATTLMPTRDEMLAAAVGGRIRSLPRARKAPVAPVAITLVQGSLTTADDPLIIGAYANDGLKGTTRLVNERLGGRLERARQAGMYPNHSGEALVFLQPAPDARPKGAIVVGLGPVGTTAPGDLARAYEKGLFSYAESLANEPAGTSPQSKPMKVATLLIGTGFGGLSIGTSVRAFLEAVRRVARHLNAAPGPVVFSQVTIFEQAENRALAASMALTSLLRDSRFAGTATYDGRVVPGAGGYRPLVLDEHSLTATRRVHITADRPGNNLNFTLITDRARNVLEIEPSQRHTIDSMLKDATGSADDRSGLSRAMFELLVPNAFKDGIADSGGLILGLDYEASEYPWELLRDVGSDHDAPLSTRIGLVRQLATSRGRQAPRAAGGREILVIGDTDSGYAELPGAKKEAQSVSAQADANGYAPTLMIRPHHTQVWSALFDRDYFAIHLACHGEVDKAAGVGTPECEGRPSRSFERTGAVLGKGVLLTSAQIAKLRRVPAFVFLNCCHLGDTSGEAGNQWNRLAANLGTQLIEMGCRAVIAAGWAVDDMAAETFSEEFYRAMFAGERFMEAVRRARRAAYDRCPQKNTWGAYQAYGDEDYQFSKSAAVPAAMKGPRAAATAFINAAHLLAELDRLKARAESQTDAGSRSVLAQEALALDEDTRGLFQANARVHETFGVIFGELGQWEPAIRHYRAALQQEDAGASLKAVEQLANLEARHGQALALRKDAKSRKEGDALLATAIGRLEWLLRVNESVESLSVLAATYKRLAQVASARAAGQAKKARAGAKAKKPAGKAKPAAAGPVVAALESMVERYEQAATRSASRQGRPDYYPTFNWLCGIWLIARRTRKGAARYKEESPKLAAHVADMVADSRLKLAAENRFFHAMAPSDARLLALLWHYPGTGTERALDHLATDYASAIQRFGSAREVHSVYGQFAFLAEMLPAQAPEREALGKLERLIKEKLAKQGM